jgi:predicted amidohydrolase
MKIAAVQISVNPGEAEANTEKILVQLTAASQGGADVVVFPEMSDTGYNTPLIFKTAQTWETGTVAAL